MFTQSNGIVFVRQHKAEHHLYPKHQGMEVPDDGWLIQQGNSVSRGNTAKGFHALLKKQTVIRRHHVMILVKNHGGHIGKG